ARYGEAFVVERVEDVVVIDREIIAAADPLQVRGAGGVRILRQRDDRLADVPEGTLRDRLQLAVRAVGDIQPGPHHPRLRRGGVSGSAGALPEGASRGCGAR